MKTAVKKQSFKRRSKAGLLLTGFLMLFSCTLIGVCNWIRSTFNISFQELLFTLTSPLVGSDMSIAVACLKQCVPFFFLALFLFFWPAALFYLQGRIRIRVSFRFPGRSRSFDLLKTCRRGMVFLTAAVLATALWYANYSLKVMEYLQLRAHPTTIFEDYFIDPQAVEITPPQEKKNLIYIYMESMETTYASQEAGGYQSENYMPNLTQLAQENCSFSNSDRLGGFRAYYGATWTMGAMFATTAGAPFSFPAGENSMDKHTIFASGCTTLGDILEDNGYHNVFLCGSDATFAGRRKYFQQHGNYTIYDLFTARDEGYIPPDYYVWWGYEDEVLYRIAKDKLTQLAQSSQPFNFTMLTVDTHHVDGWVCPLCENQYESTTANVVACADRQIMEFIQWCVQQDFYENTSIVIIGDHPRMDENLVRGVEFLDRTVYNCFLNCGAPEDLRTTFREFTSEDLFPTVLSALGFDIEGDQLGLGTNLFSDQDTLSETLGKDYLNLEYAKYSAYFEEHLV